MEIIDPICLRCKHFGKPNRPGCQAFPGGIPYSYPPNNKHDKLLPGQVGDYVFTPIEGNKEVWP